MPLPKPLPALRRDLQDLLTEDLAAALSALRELLPENTDKHGLVLALLGRLKDANKERVRNTISNDDYQRRIDTVRAECFDLVAALEEVDFEVPESGAASAKASAARQGSILYRVPHRMPLQKPTICTIRVAIDEDAILEDIVLDDDVRLRPRVEVSDMMRAELLDPDGAVFSIRSLSETEQLVREQGYTQWLFSVKPRVEGVHQLLVKVSMMEYNPQLGRYVPREVSVLETVTIVTEAVPADLEPAPLKPSGEQVTIGPQTPAQPAPSGAVPPVIPGSDWKFDKVVDPKPQGAVPPASAPFPTRSVEETMPQTRSRGGVRALAVLLIFILAGSGATWAFTPAPVRAWWVVSFQDTAEAYAGYVEKYGDDPRARTRVEKALFLKSEKTGLLADLRQYQRAYPEGEYRTQVLERVNQLDNRALANIRRQPDAEKINRYVQDFPESERLPELREALGQRSDLLPVLEKAYLQSIQKHPTEKKVRAYLRDFPESERLPEVTKAAKTRPELFRQVQPELEDAYLKKLEAAPTEREAEQFLKSFPAPQKREKFEQILEQKPQLRRRVIEKMERSRDVGVWDRPVRGSEAVTSSHRLTSSAEPSRFDYEMVAVQGGSFTMGCLEDRDGDCQEDEKPAHKVTLSTFQIGKYEVTQAQWRAVMGSDPPELYNKGCDQCPVEGVSWNDVQNFLITLNTQTGNRYRLPTEAEWEYAARGGAKSKEYRFAGSNSIDEVAWYSNNYEIARIHETTHMVGQKKPNELGLYDMSGNVDEWCNDWYKDYSSDELHDPKGPASGYYRVIRGGSWLYGPRVCRVAGRSRGRPGIRKDSIGFRLAKSQ